MKVVRTTRRKSNQVEVIIGVVIVITVGITGIIRMSNNNMTRYNNRNSTVVALTISLKEIMKHYKIKLLIREIARFMTYTQRKLNC